MTKEQRIAYEPATKNKRIEAAVTREIRAAPRIIFPLACPVEELRWIPEWDYHLIYSKSGVNELNCIFNEEKLGPLFFEKPVTTTWVTILHDPKDHRVAFHLNLSGKAVIRMDTTIREVGDRVSTCTWQMVFTALDEEANAMAKETIREKLELAMGFLADSLKHYCETGEMIG